MEVNTEDIKSEAIYVVSDENIDSLIDKIVRQERERMLQDLENVVKHTDNIEMRTFLYVDQIKHLITNKSDINKLTE